MYHMIGQVEVLPSNCYRVHIDMDRKRRRLDSAGSTFEKTTPTHSSPPKWHLSLKQHLEINDKVPTLGDTIQLLVDTGYIDAVDILHLSLTCTTLHCATNRETVWLSLCKQEFPGFTSMIPQKVLSKRGYKWLYREWRSTSQNQYIKPAVQAPLLPPRLSSNQIMIYVHFSVNENPMHQKVFCLTGEELLPLISTGKMLYMLPEPIILDTSNAAGGTLVTERSRGVELPQGMTLNIRMHLLSIPDATMCCIYNSNESIPVRLRELKQAIQFRRIQVNCAGEGCYETNYFQNHYQKNCELLLRNTTNAIEIRNRLSSIPLAFHLSSLQYTLRSATTDQVNSSTNNFHNCETSIKAININVLKCDNKHGSLHVDDNRIFDSTKPDQNNHVTLLHYLSELQMS